MTPPRMPRELQPRMDRIGFKIVRAIGAGYFAVVYLIEQPSGLEQGRKGACKVSTKTPMIGDEPVEVRIMKRKLRDDPCFVRYYFSHVVGNKSFIVTEYCDLGNLDVYNHRVNNSGEEHHSAFIWHVFLSGSRALDSAHRSGVIHRDVKPTNFLLKSVENDLAGDMLPEVKLGDWGISAVKADPDYSQYSEVAPHTYRPQDIPNLADEQCDVWGLGATIHTLMFQGKIPGAVPEGYNGIHDEQLYEVMTWCLKPWAERITSYELRDIMERFAPPRIQAYYDYKAQMQREQHEQAPHEA